MIILTLIIILGIYFGIYRNTQVCDFRIYLATNIIFTGDNWREKYDIYTTVSYEKMLFSFKPLKLKSFYTTEEIEILTKKEDLAK